MAAQKTTSLAIKYYWFCIHPEGDKTYPGKIEQFYKAMTNISIYSHNSSCPKKEPVEGDEELEPGHYHILFGGGSNDLQTFSNILKNFMCEEANPPETARKWLDKECTKVKNKGSLP